METLVRTALLKGAPDIRNQFMKALAKPLAEFVPEMASAFQASKEFDEFAKGNEDREKVSCLVFSAVQGHLISMRLFLDGFVVQSGNAQRQVLESIALAVLFSRPDLGFLQRFSHDEYKSNRAIRDLSDRYAELGVEKKAIEEIKNQQKFYHLFSHPSKMTIALYISFSDPNALLIGGMYDPAKLEQYEKEAMSRVKLARILTNFISGVRRNLEDPPSK